MNIHKMVKVWITSIGIIVILSIILDAYFCVNKFTAIGQYIILTLTLIALIIYAWDNHRIANATEQKWEEELKPKLLYDMGMNPSDPSDVRFRLINPTDFLIEAKINCNLKIYGELISFPSAYDGSETWGIFPHQISEGHFSLDTVLAKKGKTRSEMTQNANDKNQTEQLTMDLEISFENENGRKRKYPARRHYFLFKQGKWVPELTKNTV